MSDAMEVEVHDYPHSTRLPIPNGYSAASAKHDSLQKVQK